MDKLLDILPCRVAGGFTTNEKVYDWLDKGAAKVVVDYSESNLGFLDGVPKERVCIALPLPVPNGRSIKDALAEIRYYAKSVLLQPTTVDRAAIEEVKSLVEKGTQISVQDPAPGAPLMEDDIAYLDAAGIETVLGESLSSGALPLAKAVSAVIVSDRPDGLIPTIVVDEDNAALGLCYSNHESLAEALKQQVGVYWSRTRGLWVKGLTSGSTQELIRIDLDCDRDAMRFVVRQAGSGFCHMDQLSCFGEDQGSLGGLMRLLIDRKENAPAGSYTKRLFDDPALLRSKLFEECEELLAADSNREVAFETADVIYFAFAACARHGVSLAEVQRSLARKHLRVRRRPGNAKPPGWKPGDPSPDAPTV